MPMIDAGQEARDELDRRARTIWSLEQALAAERALSDELAAALDLAPNLIRIADDSRDDRHDTWTIMLDALARRRAARQTEATDG